MKRVLFLDDEKYRHDGAERFVHSVLEGGPFEIHHVWNANDAVKALKKHPFDAIFLDHDLGYGGDGTDVAEWMAKNVTPSVPVLIHSFNASAAMRMRSILTEAGFNADLRMYRSDPDGWPF